MLALVGKLVDYRSVRNGAVIVEDNIIRAVVPVEELREWGVDEVYGGENYLVIPGLINAHTHVAMAKFRGLGEDLPTEEWLEKIIWPMELEWTRREIRKWAEIGIKEALMNGSTTINDHYFFADEIAKVAERLGVRAFIGQTVMDEVDFSPASPDEGFRFFRRWQNKSELVKLTLAPHATNTVSLDLLREIAELSEETGARVHIHLAQSRAEVSEVRRRYGLSPVGLLERAGLLNGRLIGVHGVYLDDSDFRSLAKAGPSLVHCPTSNVKLEAQTVNLRKLLDLGLNVALGNDSPNPTGILDPFLEMRTAGIVANLTAGRAHAVPARELFGMATVRGAHALGLKAGLIEPGYLADLVLINADKPWFRPIENVYSLLVYSVRGSDVEKVVVNGRPVHRKIY
ncbi:amidohydrolase family protein [Thermococcus gammatolerans]|uniref:Metal-dependent chlorohydrolase family protein n=1 Tax=Thermococcus gammatolerans (strain DSM 15229 / JCM 11827 / EJ3) TaxID=593117 RepID=C5A4R9_THEGJ|nr:amidohydrolase [Thermococcus gammatolerans]ACS33231.1 Metal-dependent chlorohydrolase family protein [Thermococcus gammatolerans EJ3]